MKVIKRIGIIVMMISGLVLADYQNTAAGTTISSPGTDSVISYQVGGVPQTATSSIDADANVTQNGGIKLLSPTWTYPGNNTVIAGTGYDYTFSIGNSGNFTETVTTDLIALTGGFSTTWLSSISSASIDISREGISPLITLSVTADATATDGDTGTLTVDLFASAGTNVYGEYDGNNNYTYGASQNISTLLSFLVSAPSISITKNVSITAPADYIANGGGANDPVPGATLEYTIDYENSGSTTANSVTIVDNIPTDTEYMTAIGGTGIEYDYGSGFVATVPDDVPVDPDVQAVRWTLGDLSAGDNGTVTLRVVIR